MATGQVDRVFVAIVCCLTGTGLWMVASAGEVWGLHYFGSRSYFVSRQLLFAVVGIFVMTLASRIPVLRWKEWAPFCLASAFVLLVAVLIPGIGMVRNGSQSWIGVGPFSLQPSEWMKVALIVYLAHSLAERKSRMHSFWRGLSRPIFLICAAFLLIMLQPDMGTAAVMGGTAFLMLFCAGAPIRFFVAVGSAALAGFAVLILSAPYRLRRITAYLDPWSDPLGSGFQMIQSLYALGPGGFFGSGYGNSRQKFFYLPEPQTDFIFAIWSEETGLIGACWVIGLFFAFVWRGLFIALRIEDLFIRLLLFGFSAMIGIQSLMNMSVVTGLIPVTGVTLPFLSYGGSSLTVVLFLSGVMASASRHNR